jgi:ParB-like chromosome segregation protein Spo0J
MELTPTAKLIPSPWNPRILTKERFDNLCKSITERPTFLEDRPILARLLPDGTGEVYGGNQRLHAICRLYEEGWQSPWGYGMVPAVIREMPETEAKALALIDNSEWGQEDADKTAELLYEIGNQGVELDVLGYDELHLKVLLDSIGALGEPDFQPVSEDDQGRLDQRAPVTCPECGNVFSPS